MLNEPPGRWWLTPQLTPQLTPRLTWTTARLSELTQQAVLHLTRRIRAEHSWSAESQPKALTPHPRSLFLNLYSIDSDHVNYIWNKLGPVSVNSDESLFSRISDVSWLWDKDQTSVAVCCFATQTSVWLFMKTESLDFIIILHTSIDLASLQGTFLVCFLVVPGWLSPFWSQCFPTRIPLFVCFSLYQNYVPGSLERALKFSGWEIKMEMLYIAEVSRKQLYQILIITRTHSFETFG